MDKTINEIREILFKYLDIQQVPDIMNDIRGLLNKPDNNSNPLDAEVSDDFCIWKYDEDDDTYFTKCDNGFQVMNGSLEDNHFSYCVYCGKKVKTKKLSKNSR